MSGPLIAGRSKRPDIAIFELWKKYEDIAMHFNDLLIKLRTQALAAVAAVATVVTLFAKSRPEADYGAWEAASGVFAILILFWIAIFMIDAFYYHRLLVGAVSALLELEEISKEKTEIREINMSTRVEESVGGRLNRRRPFFERLYLMRGVWTFYAIVFFRSNRLLSLCARES